MLRVKNHPAHVAPAKMGMDIKICSACALSSRMSDLVSDKGFEDIKKMFTDAGYKAPSLKHSYIKWVSLDKAEAFFKQGTPKPEGETP